MERIEESRRQFRDDRDNGRGQSEGRQDEGQYRNQGGYRMSEGEARGAGRWEQGEGPRGGYYGQEPRGEGRAWEEGRYARGQYGEGESGYGMRGPAPRQGDYEGGRQHAYGPPSAYGGPSGPFRPYSGQQSGGMGEMYRGESYRPMGQTIQEFGGAMMGRARRIFKGPKGYKRSDERIREDVCDALSMSEELDPTEIEVTVSNGEVMLAGSVPERAMKWHAEQLVDNIGGVNEINNQLRVRRADQPSSSMMGQQPSSAMSSSSTTPTSRGSQSRS